jgi:hypothetical protein
MTIDKTFYKTLKNLSDSEIEMIRSGELSDSEINFMTSGIKSSIDTIVSSNYYTPKELKFENIPVEVKSFNSIYHHYDGDLSKPLIESKLFEFDKLSIIKSRYNTNHMTSKDHMDGDYGCKGDFSEVRVLYDDKLAAVYADCCGCHADGPNAFYEFFKAKDYHNSKTEFIKVYKLEKPLIAAINKVLSAVNKHEKILFKQKELSEIEQKTGKSKEELKRLLR